MAFACFLGIVQAEESYHLTLSTKIGYVDDARTLAKPQDSNGLGERSQGNLVLYTIVSGL